MEELSMIVHPLRREWRTRVREDVPLLSGSRAVLLLALPLALLLTSMVACATGRSRHDVAGKTVTLKDGSGRLELRLRYDRCCIVDRLIVNGKNIPLMPAGIASSCSTTSWNGSTHILLASPTVLWKDSILHVAGIRYGGGEGLIEEIWDFTAEQNGIVWKISRLARSPVRLEASSMPEWSFRKLSSWTGALLGTGGVAWFRLFDSANATYGVHTAEVTLWSPDGKTGLRIEGSSPTAHHLATRFTRTASHGLAIGFTASRAELGLKHDPGLNRRRYLPARSDIWASFDAGSDTATVLYRLTAFHPQVEFDPGKIVSFDERSLRAVAQTAARIGVIDAGLHGSNSWRTPYGPVCLHEQFIAQLGLLIQDQDYVDSYGRTLDSYRDHAIQPDGRVKPRWAYTCEDAMPGTCDSLGFYEAQWGHLLDSNPDYVTNVAEMFDFTGDLSWAQRHKESCERALEYMLRRDTDSDGLVEMLTEDHTAERGSDWIDIIWASFENAFVNAKMYWAMRLWSEIENHLGDTTRATRYRTLAATLKGSFNRATTEGGFWEPSNRWYIHWRDKDNSIHGNNLATFVNFMAIAYGICDEQDRRDAILARIEEQMRKEHLFFWPICMYTYAPGEGKSWQFPFPNYENGDIFLSLGELGVRAYAQYDPAVAVKYIRRVLQQYGRDGLAFQRYLRRSQAGAGDDILAGNCLPVVGLFRNIYGVQPKHNRLYLEPHVTPELRGTVLRYRLRGQMYNIGLYGARTSCTSGGVAFTGDGPFGVHITNDSAFYFHRDQSVPSLAVIRSRPDGVNVSLTRWDSSVKEFQIQTRKAGAKNELRVFGLEAGRRYCIETDQRILLTLTADPSGVLSFPARSVDTSPHSYAVRSAEQTLRGQPRF